MMSLPTTADPIDDMLASFLVIWDYRDPAGTETRFRELLAETPDDGELQAAVLSQIARTHSLRRNFDEAHQLLDEAESLANAETPKANVLIGLERGRTYNSNGQADAALTHFRRAFQLSDQHHYDDLAVDASHMLGIAESDVRGERWTRIAMVIAETSDNAQAHRWLGSLYNNLGWSLFERGELDEALMLFTKGVDFRKAQDQTTEWQIARWTVARTHREMGRHEEALAEQLALLQEAGDDPGQAGYIHEELAELYLLLKDPAAGTHFAKAYDWLSKDAWRVANEPERLARLKQLAD